jgi:hypothetical protein
MAKFVTLKEDAPVMGVLRIGGWHGYVSEAEYERLTAAGVLEEAPIVALTAPEEPTVTARRRRRAGAPDAIPPPAARTSPHFDEDDRTTARPQFDEPDPA